MNNTSFWINYRSLIVAVLLLATLATCTSRYRLDLFLTDETNRARVKVEETRYIPGTILSLDRTEVNVVSGDGSTAILNLGYRGEQLSGFPKFGIGFDDYVQYRLYLQLQALPEIGAMDLTNHSFLQLLGHFEIPAVTKLFRPMAGQLVIDSVQGNKLFANIEGQFQNPDGAQVQIDGRFKMKLSR